MPNPATPKDELNSRNTDVLVSRLSNGDLIQLPHPDPEVVTIRDSATNGLRTCGLFCRGFHTPGFRLDDGCLVEGSSILKGMLVDGCTDSDGSIFSFAADYLGSSPDRQAEIRQRAKLTDDLIARYEKKFVNVKTRDDLSGGFIASRFSTLFAERIERAFAEEPSAYADRGRIEHLVSKTGLAVIEDLRASFIDHLKQRPDGQGTTAAGLLTFRQNGPSAIFSVGDTIAIALHGTQIIAHTTPMSASYGRFGIKAEPTIIGEDESFASVELLNSEMKPTAVVLITDGGSLVYPQRKTFTQPTPWTIDYQIPEYTRADELAQFFRSLASERDAAKRQRRILEGSNPGAPDDLSVMALLV